MRRVCLLFMLSACFSTPQERCGFLCGSGNECPVDYQCVAADNRCHLIENGAPVASCNEAPIDAPIPLADAPFAIDAPIVVDAPFAIDARPNMPDARPAIDARPVVIDAVPMIDGP
jgi:hypothetical protein